MARDRSASKIGILGGAFDPIHYGHLRAAEEAMEMLGLDRVIFVPSAIPPHKPLRKQLSAKHRLKMVNLAIRGNPRFSVSDFECRRSVTSYSIETVEHFIETSHGRADITFILGSDAFREITTWKEFERLFTLCNMLVLSRPGKPLRGLKEALSVEARKKFCYDKKNDRFTHLSGRSIYFRGMIPLDISSSEIRRRVREGLSISYLVPPAVEKYMLNHKLYR